MEEKMMWRLSEVIAYLEDKLHSNMATEDETLLYENYIWNGKISKNDTYKGLLREMRSEYMGGY